MRLLLDTHVLIWWDQGARLKPAARAAIRDADEVFVSAASIWEIAIKASIGRIRTTRSFEALAADNGFTELPVLIRHVSKVSSLPMHHRDPFDRLLIAQALTDRMTLATRDPAFEQYRVPVMEA